MFKSHILNFSETALEIYS